MPAACGLAPPAGILLPVTLNLPRTVRSIRRVQNIVRVLTHHGFGHLVDRLRLERYIPLPKRWRHAVLPEEKDAAEISLGRRLAMVLESLGPTFIKLGQTLSTRPDLFPPDIISELVQLQDRVPPFDSAEARRIVTEALGSPIEECFSSFDADPFASGSIAQVHRAVTRAQGTQLAQRVVVKVKRPDIEDIIRLDMTILRWIADLAERLIPELQLYRPKLIVEEFERNLLREMDFINEAAVMTRFGESFKDDPNFRIPRVYWEYSGPSVLTLQELHGISAQRVLESPDLAVDRRAIADKLARSFVRQFFEIGLFHGDPHPGNLLIEPPASIGLIDFGLTGRIDDQMLGQLVLALVAAFNREPELIVEILADMDALDEYTDRVRLRNDFLQLIEKYYGLPLHRFDTQVLFYEVTDLIRQHNVTLPREFVLFGKALVAVGGICLQLDPNLNLVGLIRPQLQTIIAKRLSPSRLLKSTAVIGWHLANIIKSAPGQMRDISRRLSRGRWQVNIRHQNLDDLAHELDRSSNRLAFAIVIGAVIVGSSMVVTAETTEPILGIPLRFMGLAGYIVAGIMGLGLVINIIRSGKVS